MDVSGSATQLVRNLAQERGLRNVQFTPLQPIAHEQAFRDWLEKGYHGELEWMSNALELRLDPRKRIPDAKSAAVFSVFHHHQRPAKPTQGRQGQVARYAWGRDYHNLIGKRLRRLQKDLRNRGIPSWGGVDTAPILEREWAQLAGLGFSGKNTMQILPGRSSFFFLAVLFLPFDVPPAKQLGDHCGRCQRCIVGCPTNAFPSPHVLDGTKCISYWTIEAKGLPPIGIREKMGTWVFGCDVCQEVCPHNHRPEPGEEDDFLPRNAWLNLDELVLSSDEALLDRFQGTPIRRAKPTGLKRNALICLGNLGDPDAIPTARKALAAPDPVVRASAVWCLRKLGGFSFLPQNDPDPLVQKELC